MACALVVAAGGVGDLVRITPLVSVCHALGYDVDMLINADFAGADDLFRDASEPGVTVPHGGTVLASGTTVCARQRHPQQTPVVIPRLQLGSTGAPAATAAWKGGKNTSRRMRSEMFAGPTLVPLSG